MTCKADNYDIDLLCRLSYIQIFLKNDNFFKVYFLQLSLLLISV